MRYYKFPYQPMPNVTENYPNPNTQEGSQPEEGGTKLNNLFFSFWFLPDLRYQILSLLFDEDKINLFVNFRQWSVSKWRQNRLKKYFSCQLFVKIQKQDKLDICQIIRDNLDYCLFVFLQQQNSFFRSFQLLSV